MGIKRRRRSKITEPNGHDLCSVWLLSGFVSTYWMNKSSNCWTVCCQDRWYADYSQLRSIGNRPKKVYTNRILMKSQLNMIIFFLSFIHSFARLYRKLPSCILRTNTPNTIQSIICAWNRDYHSQWNIKLECIYYSSNISNSSIRHVRAILCSLFFFAWNISRMCFWLINTICAE